jgi:hypothetical protein
VDEPARPMHTKVRGTANSGRDQNDPLFNTPHGLAIARTGHCHNEAHDQAAGADHEDKHTAPLTAPGPARDGLSTAKCVSPLVAGLKSPSVSGDVLSSPEVPTPV